MSNMYKIVTHKSSKNKTRIGHLIYIETPCEKSYASLILLQDDFKKVDIDYLNELDANDYKKRILFSRSFLHNVLNEKGDLCCTYCGKEKLLIEEDGCVLPARIKATIDHVVPISKDGGVYDTENLVVACENCNKKKSNYVLYDFLRNNFIHFSHKTKLQKLKKFLSENQINHLLQIGYELI